MDNIGIERVAKALYALLPNASSKHILMSNSVVNNFEERRMTIFLGK